MEGVVTDYPEALRRELDRIQSLTGPNDVRELIRQAPLDEDMNKAGNERPFFRLTGVGKTKDGRSVQVGPVGYRNSGYGDIEVPLFIDGVQTDDIMLDTALNMDPPLEWKIEDVQARFNYNYRAAPGTAEGRPTARNPRKEYPAVNPFAV
tara:strand:+ start:222 stop:671 length:450 start_codon:yes stop_codon:yes gene_type:complete